jgi:predicted Fe-Mo cluster-binding NifX family protein
MRLAITSQGDDLEADVDPRFGRTAIFLVVDSETLTFEVFENEQNLTLPQGAGIQAAQNIVAHGPDVVLTGNCGPKAFKVLNAAGVKVVVGVKGRVREAVRDYLDGRYLHTESSNVEGHWV